MPITGDWCYQGITKHIVVELAHQITNSFMQLNKMFYMSYMSSPNVVGLIHLTPRTHWPRLSYRWFNKYSRPVFQRAPMSSRSWMDYYIWGGHKPIITAATKCFWYSINFPVSN